MAIAFTKIEYSNVFTRDFNPFTHNNKIVFPSNSEEIAVIYGPNGTGKTSLIKVLSDSPGTSLEFEYDGITYNSGKDVFYVINDQNSRNIIFGETRDFFLGDNIQREYELQNMLVQKRSSFISTVLSILKGFKITTKQHPITDSITDAAFRSFIQDCANSKSKGSRYTDEQIVKLLKTQVQENNSEFSQACVDFMVDDYSRKKPIIAQIEALADKIILPNHHVREIEENTEAIAILSRFHKDQCIVCDTKGIDREALLTAKTENRDKVQNTLDPMVKTLLEELSNLSFGTDPFNLKQRLLQTLEDGNIVILSEVLSELNTYKHIICVLLQNAIIDAYNREEIESIFYEYQLLVATQPEISQEDFLYIQEIAANSMNKVLEIKRDEKRHLRIHLANQEFLGLSREELPLSTGEQNFLSLTFEFLKAKNSNAPIIVIDDPVSSFDSIYKNKVVYAIVKILNHKKRIVLTHNTDLIRLLDCQYRRCFKLYLLNNTDGGLNGFIPLNQHEQEMLISLEKLLDAIRNDVPKKVRDVELYLISMIPFMRGYANIVGKKDVFNQLTQVMHGYKTESADIAKAYIELFGNPDGRIIPSYCVKVSDILSKSVDTATIVDTNDYPLLNRTLKHSFQYLTLRLAVEKTLVEKYKIDTNQHPQLGQIIAAAFPNEKDVDQIRNRIRLTSKKTLINEFNHFEGNLSIFQPAIDISDQALNVERANLLSFIENM